MKNLKSNIPAGTIIECIFMDDPNAVPPKTQGTVIGVDDLGTIHVKWDNGQTLGITDKDNWKVVK